MGAKDTVISWERIRMILQEQNRKRQHNNMFRVEAIAEAQAEITWKAREPEIIEAKQEGIKEVVEWVNAHLHESPQCSYKWCFGDRVWQAQLKKWGVK